MKLLFNALVCFFVLPLSLFCQEKFQKFTVEPKNDQTRIVLSFVGMTETNYKMDSMIIDLNSIKDKNDKPKSVNVDFVSTVRSLTARKKERKILLIRWNDREEIEMKCDEDWTKKGSDSAAQKIIETTKNVIQNVPLNSKEATEITLSDEMVKNIKAVFDLLKPVNFSCLRTIN